jgi:two-component system, OmpR family, phosphate regulon sensor histidine kinase PhoR
VSSASRRTFVYWLLLLLPTVGVGVGAIVLLRREQARLAERSTYADEARRAAVTARARLIAENVELLAGDVQAGLLDLLAEESPESSDRLLEQLEKSNPLIRTVFRVGSNGTILRPAPNTADDDGRGFLRRFGKRLAESPPWQANETDFRVSGSLKDQLLEKNAEEPLARQQVAANVSKVQNARRDVQALSKGNYSSAPSSFSSTPRAERSAPSKAKQEVSDSSYLAQAPAAVAAAPLLARHGWLPVKVEGRLHLLGWVQLPGSGEVRGVEIEMAALISRFGDTLPAEIASDEGYALRDDQERVLHQAGAIPRAVVPSIRVPLASDLLPGWEVVAFVPTAWRGSSAGQGFFVIGSLLVGIFLVAIVAGGFLLFRQARQSEAEAAQKTSFVSNVSHEFKTPLTTIRLYSELLEQGRVRDAAQSREYLLTIGRETQRLARLVGNALDFSRLEQGQKKYARDRLDLCAELGRLLDTQVPRMVEASLVLKRVLPEAPLQIISDRDAVEQIVLNLLDNAVKYGGTGGEISVQLVEKKDGGAIVRVLDRGPGVPAGHRDRIFDKFHRVDDSLTSEKTGTGLGLSIARQLARGLGGELRYTPREGGGAGFILELP